MTVIQSSAWRSENSFPAGAGRAATDLVLVAFYVFQALLAGLALWQGNRVFYPGQVAWTPLVAVTLVTAVRGVRKTLS